MESLIKSNNNKILYRVVIVNFTACRCYFKTYRVNMFGVQPKFHVCIVKNLNVDVDIAYIYLTKFFLEHKYAMKGFYKEFTLLGLSVVIANIQIFQFLPVQQKNLDRLYICVVVCSVVGCNNGLTAMLLWPLKMLKSLKLKCHQN